MLAIEVTLIALNKGARFSLEGRGRGGSALGCLTLLSRACSL